MTVAPEFALALIVALVSATGSFFATKFGGQETQRLVKALHGRFDKLESDVHSIQMDHARLDERVEALRETQRFKMRAARLESAALSQPPMFKDEDSE